MPRVRGEEDERGVCSKRVPFAYVPGARPQLFLAGPYLMVAKYGKRTVKGKRHWVTPFYETAQLLADGDAKRQVVLFDFTSVTNYPKGKLSGVELETRQDLGRFWREARGITVGANATFIRSRVDLPQEEIDNFVDFTDVVGNEIDYVITSRDMVFSPEHLYNLFLTYEMQDLDAELGIFYTLTGDTLLEGATAEAENFVPNVYAKQFGTLNLSYQQRISDGVVLRIQAKNITNPAIDTVYRFDQFETDNQIKSTFTRGVEFSLGVSVSL